MSADILRSNLNNQSNFKIKNEELIKNDTKQILVFDSQNHSHTDNYPADGKATSGDVLSEKLNSDNEMNTQNLEEIRLISRLMSKIDNLQALADLNAQSANEERVRADRAEGKAGRLANENADLQDKLARTQFRLDSALQDGQLKRTIIDELRRSSTQSGIKDPNFSVLGLDPSTAFSGLTPEQKLTVLEGAFRTRSKIFHPDKGGDSDQMRRIISAFETIKRSIK